MKTLEHYGKVVKNIELKKITSYHLSGIADTLVIPNSLQQLKDLLKYIKENNFTYKIIGGGSNLIFNGDYKGILIKLDQFDELKITKTHITVGAGYNLIKLALKVSKLGLTGMEFATGIPGTVGGAIYNNSGAYKSDMGYIVKKVTVITPNLEIKTLDNSDLNCHYRTSMFKEYPGYIILSAEIELQQGNKKEILEIIQDRKKRRLETQPLEYPSAGSVFRNPPNLYAGKLIEDSGYKGFSIHDAMVSDKHANFIINKGNASGKDIIELIEQIKDKVKEKYQIDLILEQEIVK